MAGSSADDSTHNTHQVLSIAVGLGVGVPVLLVIIAMWFFTWRHRRTARKEDERHKAIDLDAEISGSEDRKRRHKPIPGSVTYLAKQHAASQRDLMEGNHDLVNPNARRDNVMSYVSHETDRADRADLVYTPYAHEKESASLENLTRDLTNFDAPSYPKIPHLRSSSSFGSLQRDEWSRRTSFSDDPHSVSSRQFSQQSSPVPDRKKSQGHGTVLKLYDQYQPRFEESRRPSTLKEEEETRKSPFDDHNSDTFSFDDQRKTRDFSENATADDTITDHYGSNNRDSFQAREELESATTDGEYEDYEFDEPANVTATASTSRTALMKTPQSSAEPSQTSYPKRDEADDSYESPPSEEPLFEDESPQYESAYDEDITLEEQAPAIPPHQHSAQAYEEEEEVPVQTQPDAQGHSSAQLGAPIDTRPASSIYELSTSANQHAPSERNGNIEHHVERHMDRPNGPKTPQMQTNHFDYHLESSPLSPQSPLHSVPSYPTLPRHSRPGSAAGSRPGSRPGSRRTSMSNYIADVPVINQGIPGSPGSGRTRIKYNNTGSGAASSSQTMDSSVFLQTPKKFNKNGGKKNKLPSASQLAL